jgi:hypothetical protein
LQSLLDQVNILINMNVGDAYRLEHIKLMLKQKRTVYGSDRVYLDHLIYEYIEQIKTQKQLAKIRGEDPFEEDSEDVTSEENVEDKSNDDIMELDHIYCWKCGKSIPVNSKFCLDCGSDIKKPEIKDNALVEDKSENIIEEISKHKSTDGNKKNILMVVGVLAILAIIGGAVVMGGTFDKTISLIGDDRPSPKEITNTVESASASKCGAGTIFDGATNSCILAGTQTNSQCGAGTIFDGATNSCILAGT